MPKNEQTSVDAEIGRLIATVRKRRKVTRGMAADMLDISYPMLQKHERGVTPITVSRLMILAGALDVPLTDFLPTSNTKPNHRHLFVNDAEYELIQAFRELPDGVRKKIVEMFSEILKSLH